MKTSKKVIAITVIGLVIGINLVCIGLLFDPFSIPFQDYEQIPLEAQHMYETRSELMQIMRLFGGGIAILALMTIPFTWLVRRQRTPTK